MTLATMRVELKARGFDFLSDARCTAFINEGYHAICDWDGSPWPFLNASTTGVAPLVISDLREIVYVTDTTMDNRLEQATFQDIVDMDPSIEVTGTPERYYLSGLTLLNVWPANTSNSLFVRYNKYAPDLSLDADVPFIPTRYQPIIVDMAEVLAYQDASDYAEANAKLELVTAKVQRMQTVLLHRANDDPDYIVVTNHDLNGGWC